MAEDVVLARFRADLDQVRAQFEGYIKQLERVQNEESDTQKATKQTATTAAEAARRRSSALKEEQAELRRLQIAVKQAFTPTAIEEFNRKINESKQRIATLRGETQNVGGSLKSVFAGVGAGVAAAFSVNAIINFSEAAVQAFAKLESSRLVFKNLVGDAAIAKRVFEQLQDFAIKSPFTQDEIETGAKALLQFGVTADEVVPQIKILGDVSAGTGKNLGELAIIFGQIKSTGRLMGQDLLQLINAGFNPLQEISEQTGVSVRKLKQEMERGNVTFDMVAKAFETATSEGGKFYKLTEQLGTTTAGRLSTLSDEANKLSQTIGEQLAPVLVGARAAFLRFTTDALSGMRDLVKFIQGIDIQESDQFQKQARDRIDATTAEVEGIYDQLIKTGLKEEEARTKAIQMVEARLQRDVKPLVGISTEEASRELALLRAEIDALATINKQLEERAKKQSAAAAMAASDKAEADRKLAEDAAAAAKKAAAAADVRIAGSEAEIKTVEALEAQYRDLFKLLNDPVLAKQIELSITGESDLVDSLKSKIKLLEDTIISNKVEVPIAIKADDNFTTIVDQVTELTRQLGAAGVVIPVDISQLDDLEVKAARLKELFTTNGLPLPVFADPDKSIEGLERRLRQLIKFAEDNEIKVSVKADEVALGDFRAQVAQEAVQIAKDNTIPLKLEPKVDALAFNDGIAAVEAKTLRSWLENNEDILNSTTDLLYTLGQLYGTFADARITKIEEATNKELAALDRLAEGYSQQLDKRQISEREFANKQILIEEQKVKAQEQADRKIRELKRKQAVLDKAAALIQIAIDTARGFAETIGQAGFAGIPLGAIVLATGAAQAAIVAATPIPYEKGTKEAKGGLSKVGERGPELMFVEPKAKIVPAGPTKKHAKLIDAMVDDRAEDYIFKTWVTPELEKQRKRYETVKERSLARNITESIIISNGISRNEYAAEQKKGVRINNLDELASAVVQRLGETSPYRR
jgi:tape measure domain-containing protein